VKTGAVYVVDFRNDKKHGNGSYTEKQANLNDIKYTGEWQDDMKHGKGEFIDKNGNKYNGNWTKDKKNG
jgi:hypothetical protein